MLVELTLGPVLFEWKRDELMKFYEEAAVMDIDRVYVGEVVCTKRLGLSLGDLGSIIRLLTDAGKKVTLSSLAVVSNDEELDFTRRLLETHGSIEANDMSVLNMADMKVKEVFAGPHITSYNAPSIGFLRSAGVKRVTFPVELPRDSIAHSIKHTGICNEVFAHGKVPLAFSWRCYTSRAYGLSKTECRHHCAKFPDGMEIKTVDNEPVFSINGTSVLSAGTYTLIEEIDDLRAMGVNALRVSPQYRNTRQVVDLFRQRMNGKLGPGEALAGLKAVTGESFCNGWYRGGAGKDYLTLVEA